MNMFSKCAEIAICSQLFLLSLQCWADYTITAFEFEMVVTDEPSSDEIADFIHTATRDHIIQTMGIEISQELEYELYTSRLGSPEEEQQRNIAIINAYDSALDNPASAEEMFDIYLLPLIAAGVSDEYIENQRSSWIDGIQLIASDEEYAQQYYESLVENTPTSVEAIVHDAVYAYVEQYQIVSYVNQNFPIDTDLVEDANQLITNATGVSAELWDYELRRQPFYQRYQGRIFMNYLWDIGINATTVSPEITELMGQLQGYIVSGEEWIEWTQRYFPEE